MQNVSCNKNKLMKYLYTLLLLSAPMVSAYGNNNSELIDTLAEKHQCHPGAPERVKHWSLTLNKNNAKGIMFWCKIKKHKYKLLVSTTLSAHPWANCPDIVNKNISLSPLNLELKPNNSVSAEYDSGGYIFTCINNIWKIKGSH